MTNNITIQTVSKRMRTPLRSPWKSVGSKAACLSLLVAGMFSSCYEDKGNYTYNFDGMNAIDTLIFSPASVETLTGQTIEFTQPLTADETHKRIEVQVGQTLLKNTDHLDFQWIRSYQKNKETVTDTFTTKGYLDVELPVGKATRFTVHLKVHDRSTGLSRYQNFAVATRPIYKNSLFFLHGKAGSVQLGNVETVGAVTNVRSDAYKLIFKEEKNPFTDAYKLMFQYGLVAEGRDFLKKQNFIVFLNKGEVKAYDPFGLTPRYTAFKDFVVPVSAQGAFLADKIGMTGDPSNQSDFYYMLGKDGRFLTARTIPSFKTPATEGSVANYNVTAAAITASHFVLWDGRNNRFLYVSNDDGYGIWAEQRAYQAQLNNPVLDAQKQFTAIFSIAKTTIRPRLTSFSAIKPPPTITSTSSPQRQLTATRALAAMAMNLLTPSRVRNWKAFRPRLLPPSFITRGSAPITSSMPMGPTWCVIT